MGLDPFQKLMFSCSSVSTDAGNLEYARVSAKKYGWWTCAPEDFHIERLCLPSLPSLAILHIAVCRCGKSTMQPIHPRYVLHPNFCDRCDQLPTVRPPAFIRFVASPPPPPLSPLCPPANLNKKGWLVCTWKLPLNYVLPSSVQTAGTLDGIGIDVRISSASMLQIEYTINSHLIIHSVMFSCNHRSWN